MRLHRLLPLGLALFLSGLALGWLWHASWQGAPAAALGVGYREPTLQATRDRPQQAPAELAAAGLDHEDGHELGSGLALVPARPTERQLVPSRLEAVPTNSVIKVDVRTLPDEPWDEIQGSLVLRRLDGADVEEPNGSFRLTTTYELDAPCQTVEVLQGRWRAQIPPGCTLKIDALELEQAPARLEPGSSLLVPRSAYLVLRAQAVIRR